MPCSNDIIDVLKNLLPNDVYIQVGVANPDVNDGVAVEGGDTSFKILSFIGWKVRVWRNKAVQFPFDMNDGDTWYDYTSITGEFTPSTTIAEFENFYCQAYKPA